MVDNLPVKSESRGIQVSHRRHYPSGKVTRVNRWVVPPALRRIQMSFVRPIPLPRAFPNAIPQRLAVPPRKQALPAPESSVLQKASPQVKDIERTFKEYEDEIDKIYRADPKHAIQLTHGFMPVWRSILTEEQDKWFMGKSSADDYEQVFILWEELLQRLQKKYVVWTDEGDSSIMWAAKEWVWDNLLSQEEKKGPQPSEWNTPIKKDQYEWEEVRKVPYNKIRPIESTLAYVEENGHWVLYDTKEDLKLMPKVVTLMRLKNKKKGRRLGFDACIKL
jgi:hypothetical protein